MKYLMALPLIAAVAACADQGANYNPILDGEPSAAFRSDLAACQSLARNQKQIDKDTMNKALLGAGTGALLGELDADGDALGGAVIGALAGGVTGAKEASDRREKIVVRCLRGRGHNVVG